MDHAQDLSAGGEPDFAGLGPEIQLRQQAAVAEVPDSDCTIVICDSESFAARIYGHQRRRAADIQPGYHGL